MAAMADSEAIFMLDLFVRCCRRKGTAEKEAWKKDYNVVGEGGRWAERVTRRASRTRARCGKPCWLHASERV